MTTLNEISGVIASPFYPRRYFNYQSCSWEIRERKGKRIVFTIEDMDFNWWCSGRWSCLCDSLEIQGGSISGYDGPKWRLCATLSTANATYDWFKQRIKVLFFSDGSIQGYRGFKISYTQVNFSVSGKWILPIFLLWKWKWENLDAKLRIHFSFGIQITTSRFCFLLLLLFVCFNFLEERRGKRSKGEKVRHSCLLSPKSYGMPITQDTSLRHF